MVRKQAVVGIVAASMLGVGLVASPATAVMDSNCSLAVTTPVTDGNYIYSTSHVTCATYMDHTDVEVRNRIFESVFGNWTLRTDWNTKYSAGTTSLSVTQSYYCNGHGTDNWRGEGYGKTTDGGHENGYSPSASRTC